MPYFISKKDFRGLVRGLMEEYAVYGTVKKDGFPAFSRIENFSQLELGQTPTHLSAKEFLFPPRENLVKFDLEKNSAQSVVEKEKQAIIGLHSCDIHGINLMDKVFGHSTPDPNYIKRRRSTVLIAAECIPDEYCFCRSMETMTVEEGFDIFLHEIKNGYIVRAGTEKGMELLKKHTAIREAAEKEIEELKRLGEKKEKSFKRALNAKPSELPDIFKGADFSPEWDRLGKICYGCGSCNHVCPTCYCFDVKDELSDDFKRVTRFRTWDGCTLEDFAKVAGGHNFRKTRAERLRHRFNRKFRYLSDRFGRLFCVGCGRCSRTCLVKINITDSTNRIIDEIKAKPEAKKIAT